MLRVMRNHRRAAHGEDRGLRGLSVNPVALDHANCPDKPADRRCQAGLGQGAELGEKHGYRNAQATVIAPTGTIGLVMDCDTTGIEPDFALVKFKKLAGGGYFKIINRAVPEALETLGYTEAQIEPRSRPTRSVTARNQAPGINHTSLIGQGLRPDGDREGRGGAAPPSTSSSSSTSGRWARTSAPRPSASRRKS
jgi:ribonucleoside-diphosphate reductase alpha chain